MSFTPTDEQQAIIDAFTAGRNIAITAGAGAGKTSTLRLLAEATTRKGVYLAFNKAIAREAGDKFPSTVQASTVHSLAFKAVGKQFKHRLDSPRLPARETAKILRINDPLRVSNERVLPPEQVARLTMETVTRFCYSDHDEPNRWNVPHKPGLDDDGTLAVLRKTLVPLAQRAWEDLTREDGKLKFTHDHYLKMWQLTNPTLPGEFVMLDEAQDANPVIKAVFEQQTQMQRIAVGDSSQRIYGWRGAVDALDSFNADTRLALSRSFRFGDAVAGEANKWLTVLGTSMRISGTPSIPSQLGERPEPDAVLCRTNAKAIQEVTNADDAGARVALVGGGEDIKRFAFAARDLQNGKATSHPELAAFEDWGQVRDYCEQEEDGADLKTFVNLIDRHSPGGVLAILARLVPEDRADVTVSTAHKAKGREWGTVRIAEDFTEPKKVEDGGTGAVPPEDARLAYVAVTRAQRVLDREGLAWVDNWVEAGKSEPALA